MSTNPQRLQPGDVQREFESVLRESGLLPPGVPEMDGRLHRVPVDGDRTKERSGAYVGHLDGWPAGYVQNFRTGLRQTWKYSKGGIGFSREELRALRAESERRQREREAQRQRVQVRTADRLRQQVKARAFRRANPDHPYLVSKGLSSPPLLLQDRRGNLVILAYDIDGQLWSLQRIGPDGRKTFLENGRIQGMHHVLPARRGRRIATDQPLIIVEGWATGETIERLTSANVIVAFSAGNLEPVASAYRDRYPHLPIVIAGDNDHRKARELGVDGKPKPNTGQIAATAAADAVNGHVLLPEFAVNEDGSDWNDHLRLHGSETVKRELDAALAKV